MQIKTSKTLDKIIKEGKMPRREFLEYAGKGLAGLAGIGLGMKCGNPTTPEPVPVPVIYTGYLRGLMNDSSITTGEITFDQVTTIPISNGSYTINSSHNLLSGNHNVKVKTNEGITREVGNAHLSSNGLYVEKTNLPLNNVIEKNAIDINEYNNWIGISIGLSGSKRWLKYTPKFFFYDKSLWHAEGGIKKIQDNYPVNPITKSSVEDVVANDIHLYTSNFAQGKLYKESTDSDRPNPNQDPKGWIIYLVIDNTPNNWAIFQYDLDSSGDTYSGGLRFDTRAMHRGGVSIDTAQTLGIGQQHNSGEVTLGTSYPSLKAKKIAKIIYNRAPHHKIINGVDKER